MALPLLICVLCSDSVATKYRHVAPGLTTVGIGVSLMCTSNGYLILVQLSIIHLYLHLHVFVTLCTHTHRERCVSDCT